MMYEIISLRQRPEMLERFIIWFQDKWASEDSKMVYRDCMEHCLGAAAPLPQWYLLLEGEEISGGAGLIVNDFISRGDLWPWVCALYVEEDRRGRGCGRLLLDRAAADAAALGFERLYLCTDHVGYYEKYGYEYIGTGWHPWGESSRVYEKKL